MQAMAGLKVKVEIPYLNNLRNLGTVAINRAELVIPLADNDFSRYVTAYFTTSHRSGFCK
jgi:hypothetical protein